MKKHLVLRLRALGYEKASPFTNVHVDYDIKTVDNKFCPDVLGNTCDKVFPNSVRIYDLDSLVCSKYSKEFIREHITDLTKEYLLNGDEASPSGGLLNGYQTVAIQNSNIHKNMIRLDEFRTRRAK